MKLSLIFGWISLAFAAALVAHLYAGASDRQSLALSLAMLITGAVAFWRSVTEADGL